MRDKQIKQLPPRLLKLVNCMSLQMCDKYPKMVVSSAQINEVRNYTSQPEKSIQNTE